MNDNPYISLHATHKLLMERRKELEADLIKWREEFLPLFMPEEREFDELVQQAREGKYRKIPTRELDKIYYKMALIYKRWLPISEQLKAMNPKYVDLFLSLDGLLLEIEKKEEPIKKEVANEPKKKTRVNRSSSKKNNTGTSKDQVPN